MNWMNENSFFVDSFHSQPCSLQVHEEGTTIQDIDCGPTDTAILLTDGRCFVSGTNKQGQLG